MIINKLVGYLWIIGGLWTLIYFGGQLLLQLLGVIIGLSLLFKGLQIIAIDHAIYSSSMHYFYNKFKK